jgi:putative ABC transport system ATP-binding protein
MQTSNTHILISAQHIIKTFISNQVTTQVLKGISCDILESSFVAIMGRSGAGKSTFMYQLALLDDPTSGEILINNTQTSQLSEEEKTTFRRDNFGFVFQDYALIPDLTASENIMVPLLMKGFSTQKAKEISIHMLEKVKLDHRKDNLPSMLSGGEQQRVSIARALSGNPVILFADEPTANLDTGSSEVVMELFSELHKAGQTIIMVTHEPEYTKECTRIITLSDGTIVEDVLL